MLRRRRRRVENKQRPLPRSQQFAQAAATDQPEIRRAPADQRVLSVKIQLLRNTPDPFGQIGGAIAGAGQIGHDRRQRARTGSRTHQRNLRARPVQYVGANWMPFRVIAVQQRHASVTAYHAGQFPAQVHRVADAQIQALPSQRGMHVRSVAGQQHAAVAIGAGLARTIGPGAVQMQRGDGHVAGRYTSQQRLRFVQRERFSMPGTAIEIGKREHTGWIEITHALRGVLTARGQHAGIFQIDLQRMTGEFGTRADETETALLAHCAAASIATYQPATTYRPVSGLDLHFGGTGAHRLYCTPAFDAHAQRGRTFAQHRFQGLQLHRHLGAHRRRQAPGPARAVDVVQRKRYSGEVAAQRPRLREPMGGAGRRRPLLGLEHLCRGDRVQQAAPIQCLQRRGVQAAQPEWQALQRRNGGPGLFQHQH